MKRVFKKSILTGILINLLTIKLVLAQNQLIDNAFSALGNAFGSIFQPIIGGYATNEFLFTKVLMFFIVFSVVFLSLKKLKFFKGNKPALIIVALSVSILSIRYLRETEFLRAFLLPYSALGGAIIVFLPMIIFFLFVQYSDMGSFGRRAAWFLYAVIFIVLWGSRDYLAQANWIYLAGLIFVVINIIFDKSIHVYFALGSFRSSQKGFLEDQIVRYKKLLKDATDVNDDNAMRRYEEKIKDLEKEKSRV